MYGGVIRGELCTFEYHFCGSGMNGSVDNYVRLELKDLSAISMNRNFTAAQLERYLSGKMSVDH